VECRSFGKNNGDKQCKIGNVGSKLYRDSVLIDHRKIMIRKFDKTEKKAFNA
jgi:hypothetical protein